VSRSPRLAGPFKRRPHLRCRILRSEVSDPD
jgi:hypothetical protein